MTRKQQIRENDHKSFNPSSKNFPSQKAEEFKPVLNSFLKGMTFKEKIQFLTEVAVICAETTRKMVLRGVLWNVLIVLNTVLK